MFAKGLFELEMNRLSAELVGEVMIQSKVALAES